MVQISKLRLAAKQDLGLFVLFCLNFFLASFFLSRFLHSQAIYPSTLSVITVGSSIFILFLMCYFLWTELFVTINLSVTTATFAGELYQNQLENIDHSFWLKYFISSQCLIGWMFIVFSMAMIVHWVDLVKRPNVSRTKFTWLAVGCGLSGLLVRWYESYLMGSDIGHIPFSNLYEVFILFMIVTALVSLWYEKKLSIPNLGAIIIPIVVVAGLFMIWYGTTRRSYLIAPLIPALQSYWMKIHVPANFIGYGCFSAAAMVGCAWILKEKNLISSLPPLETLEVLTYQLVSSGFMFFTLATILGALWAADAWGSYWQWDPKETWALIVWLNYASWLHARFIRSLNHKILAWWTIIGLVVTLFAFLGVNIFLSGLHSYGQL
ncbi:c-type cytochrome biogenesis protein CcsB [Candidatus Ichthyocystis hellenicum]|uniref:c-type cytochrome biogenesis protein CcsB n=1 Tax=Candidatus Ichthyocystis hellenicum TaxID=1561003 RepID=UPI000A6BF12D|nr:c-type cytochrome biogenesis protein CcsB [Candidatus Ichthyocystis hellenicum]